MKKLILILFITACKFVQPHAIIEMFATSSKDVTLIHTIAAGYKYQNLTDTILLKADESFYFTHKAEYMHISTMTFLNDSTGTVIASIHSNGKLEREINSIDKKIKLVYYLNNPELLINR